jgi:hypothetical protein
MRNIEDYKQRFFNLMESTIGDVKPLINEDESTTNKFCWENPEWKEIDDDVKFKGTWKLQGNKVLLTYERSMMSLSNTEVIIKPNGFDTWRGNVTSGKIEKSYSGDYAICFFK